MKLSTELQTTDFLRLLHLLNANSNKANKNCLMGDKFPLFRRIIDHH